MKKIINPFLFVLITIATISCDPDDNNTDTNNASIIGQWQLNAIMYGTINEPLDQCELMQKLTFVANGNLDVYYDTTGNCNFATRTITYTLNGNSLTVTSQVEGANGSDYIIQNTIQTLSQTTLVFKEIADNEEGTYPPEDVVTYTYNRVN